MSPQVSIVKTGIANLASVQAGLERAGAQVHIVDSPEEVETAPFVVLPGVGAFAAGMNKLEETGIKGVLIERISSGRPTLAICLGLQLLFEESEESPGVQGLGIIPGKVQRFAQNLTVPHFGWNKVKPSSECDLLTPGYAYFANSYRVTEVPDDWSPAYTDYGQEFVSGFEKGAVLCGQFHPELSSAWGLGLLQRWLEKGQGELSC
jgi:imidazole glycerol phosphate synthase glutamine amidotransferase subunit